MSADKDGKAPRGGKLLVFSGLDSVGKSTQIRLVMNDLALRGYRPTKLWTRAGYTPGVELLKKLARRILKRRLAEPQYPQRAESLGSAYKQRLWLTASLLELIWLLGVRVRWRLTQGRIVICDRYIADALVDFRLNFPENDVEHSLLWRILASVAPTPDIVILLNVPVESSLRRSAERGRVQEMLETLERRCTEYRQLAQASGWIELDGNQSIYDLAGEIRGQINRALSGSWIG